jgi:thiol-disulfide isomerase/thioredoxin
MANASHTMTKRERKRVRAEELRAAQRRREQRRTLAFTLGAVAVIGVVVAVIVSLSGGGPSAGGGSISPSSAREVSISGPPRTSMLAVGATVPEFAAPGFHMQAASGGGYTIARAPFDWAAYAGHPTVLSIWAPWCPHCQNELPVLSEVVSKTPNVRLATVVTSVGAQPGPTPNGYLADHGLTFPVAIDDANATLARALGVQAFPTLYLVDANGKIVFANEGEVPASQLEAELAKIS